MTDETTPRRLLTRRRTLGLIGAAGVAGLAAAVGCSSSDNTATATATRSATATGTTGATETSAATAAATATASAEPVINCVAVPALTEGPYFVDELLNRSDIRTDPTTGAASDGTPLDITIRVFDGACTPLAGAHVDIWHCDAAGKYSDESANNTVGQKFLRGYQVTDDNGTAKFTTIYPGWYQGRAVHIHFKIRTYDGVQQDVRVHVAVLLRRRAERHRLPAGAVQQPRFARHAQLRGQHLRPERRPDAAHTHPFGQRLREHVRH